jgi:hypothetical protein
MTPESIIPDADGVVPSAPITLFGTDDPVAVVDRASIIAVALADVIKQRHLYKNIGQSDHVFVEGWTLLGSMLGVFAEVEWSRPLDGGWEARAVARTLAGRTVGAAESMCSRSESKWKNSDDYAIRSMAQTRAVSKALRLPLGFIMELAGYSATPAEEIPTEQTGRGAKAKPESDPAPAPAGPSLDQIKARLLARADEHHIEPARLDELIKQYVPANPDADTLKAKLIELGTDITKGMFDGLTEDEFAVVEATVAAGGAEPPQEAPKAEDMAPDAALAAGAALVGKA